MGGHEIRRQKFERKKLERVCMKKKRWMWETGVVGGELTRNIPGVELVRM